MNDPPGSKNCHFLDIMEDEIDPIGVTIDYNKSFDEDPQWKYLQDLLDNKVSEEIANRITSALIKMDTRITYPFKYDCRSGKYLYPELEENLHKKITKGNGKAHATGFANPVLGRLPKIFIDTYVLKCKRQMALRFLDIGTESSLWIFIGKPCGGIRPLTIGHYDIVFLNGLAQQAIQKEIARIQLLPDNLCSYQRGKGCNDATIVDNIVKEVALQNNTFYLAEIDNNAENFFDCLYIELQAALLLLAGVGIQGFTEWQCTNMTNRTNKLVTDIFGAL